MKQTYKIAIITPVDQRNLNPGELFSGLFVLKLEGVSYLSEDEAINAINTPPFKEDLKPGESYAILKIFTPEV